MRSETTRTRSSTCWLCRVSTPPGTPPLFEKATRFVFLLHLSLPRLTSSIFISYLTDALMPPLLQLSFI